MNNKNLIMVIKSDFKVIMILKKLFKTFTNEMFICHFTNNF